MFEFTQERRDDVAIFRLKGVVDLESAAQLRQTFWTCLNGDAPARLILDLTQVDTLDCSAISLLITTKNVATKSDTMLILVGVGSESLVFMERNNLNLYFDLRDTVEEALTGSAQPPEPRRRTVMRSRA